MRFTLHVVPRNPRAFMSHRMEGESLGPVVELTATEEVAALVEAKAKMMEIDAKIPLESACLCQDHTDLTADLALARTSKVEKAEKEMLEKLKAKYDKKP